MNVFQGPYETRLVSWHDLRLSLIDADIKTKCISVDAWWQQAPYINHYLHTQDLSSWPDPWELLVDNTYCTVAKALGMCYTLYLTGIKDIEMVEASDQQGNDLVLVLVDHAKYVLNYWPDTVVNNRLNDFTIHKYIDLTPTLKKLG